MKKIKIKKDDKNRVLLTEILPYEVPMVFSNEGFYSIVCKGQHKFFFDRIEKAYEKIKNFGIPFNFEIRKMSGNDTRTLSVIHPLFQLEYIDLYEKYNSLILHLCSKSPVSLRKISKVASFFYSPNFVFDEDSHKNEEVEVESEALDMETKYVKSYFVYEPIDLIYKFYDSTEFLKLEQRFVYMMTFDIHKCFYHIYTHSIAWAVKDKAYSKEHIGDTSFEKFFDDIMQKSNYNETNGIVVGPEISRIFAEIILQRIDLDVINTLKENHNYIFSVDYLVRRYVDDYFVFANSEDCLEKVKKVFQDKLSDYKLYINQSKTKTIRSPFISNIHVAKRELERLLESLSDLIFEKKCKIDETNNIKQFIINNPYSISNEFIKGFQCIAKRNGLTYDIISKDVILFLKRKLSQTIKNENIIKNDIGFENFLLTTFDILFYCYSMNINANTTFKVAQAIVLVCKYFDKNANNATKHTIYSKITHDINNIFTNIQRKTKDKDITEVEILNILIASKKMGESYLLAESKIKTIFELNDRKMYNKLNYFQIITLLYYIENNHMFDELKQNIEDLVIEKFDKAKNPFTESELVLLFFDYICCPFVSMTSKRDIIKKSGYCKPDAKNKLVDMVDTDIKNISEHKKWFVDWDTNIDLERILKKKEWGSSY